MHYRKSHDLGGKETGAVFGGLIGLLIGGAVLLTVFFYTFGWVVPPGFFGVRQVAFGPGQGYSERGLPPGYHWTVPFYSKIHLVPNTVQLIQFQRDPLRRGERGRKELEVQTLDGATVDVDLSIMARFYPRACKKDEPCFGAEGLHGGPGDLITNVGLSLESWENHISRVADDELRRALGRLSTGQFYNPFLREEGVTQAANATRERLREYGIGIEGVFLRRYTYRAERIDNAIFQKNLQEQEEQLNAMSSKFAEAQATLEQVAAEWDAKIQTMAVQGENRARVLRSEGDLYEAQKKAEGDLLLAKARAEVDRLRASALAQSAGADIYVARELAPLLGSLKGGVVSDVDPYDLVKWMERLGVAR